MRHSERLVAPRMFLVVDCLLVGVALAASFCSADQLKLSWNLAVILALRLTVQNLLRAAVVFLFWFLLMRILRMYTAHTFRPVVEAFRIAAAIAGTAVVLYISFGRTHQGASALHIAADFALFCFITLYGLRAVVSFLSHHSHSGLLGGRTVIIAGTGARAVRAFRYVRTELYPTHSLLGFVDSRSQSITPGEIESLFLGPISNLEAILLNNVVDEVIIALPARSCYVDIEQTVEICIRVGIPVKYPDDMFSFAPTSEKFSAPPGMQIVRPAAHDARLLIKRFIDITASSFAIVLFSPLMAVIAALIKFSSRGPVFFLQECCGLSRRRFKIVKFRTMVVDAEARLKEVESLNEIGGPVFKMRNDPRVTRIGAFLRRTSLDELPQFFNVFLGHMSLVGPRPMSIRDVSLFNQAWLMRRFSVKPGITCIWQVSGRSNTTFGRWIELDLHYIDNWSLGLDAKILAQTIPAVLKGSGAM